MKEDQKIDKRIHPDFYYGLVLLIIGGGLLLHTGSDRYDFDLLFGDVSTVFFPRIILILWILLSAILIANGLRRRGPQQGHQGVMAVGLTGLFSVLAMIIASALAVWLTGLLLGGAASMIAVGAAFGYRRWVILIPVSVVLPVIVYFALGHVAKISLPSGVLWN